MDLNYFFDEAKKVLDIERDAVLARKIGIMPQALNTARNTGQISADALLRLSEVSGLDIQKMLVAREATKAKEPEAKAAWNRVLVRVGMLTLALHFQPQVIDFNPELKITGNIKNPFQFKRLAVVLSSILGTVSRLMPRQPMPIIQ